MPWDSSAIGDAIRSVAPATTRRDLLQLVVGYGLILVVVWMPRPLQPLFYWTALAWILMATAVSFPGWNAMGFRVKGTLRSMWVVAVALLVAACAVVLSAYTRTLHVPPSPSVLVQRYWGYAIWCLVQEFLLLDFVLLRLQKLMPGRLQAVIAAAALFAIAHLPNPVLTTTTLVWGIAAGLLFLRYRNLFTISIAHATLGICIAVSVPGTITHNMRVGLGYLTYTPHCHVTSARKTI